MTCRSRAGAFTLIELLVAIAIFAVLSVLVYGALGQVILSRDSITFRMQRLQEIQQTFRVIERDFLQLAPRPARDELGDGFDPALSTAITRGFAVELTRGGWSNPLGLPRGTQQRAAYRLEEDQLIRYHWNVLDHSLSNELIERPLLDGVDGIVFLFMQENGEWTEQWPPLGRQGPQGLRLRPRAVQIVLSLADEGELSRIVEVIP